ncbi:hypothetical protein MPH_04628 [Macrophomina phaseolina MS6]|uniref:Uncharacterized protein n=1 Tax=Macrophomina phaseolina (strain MS6) TaxID=1126212 RepID=K2R6Y6_MACPH|nr:hypothetical protein MPH_04628 [Macrophomina phaseolina MS6]
MHLVCCEPELHRFQSPLAAVNCKIVSDPSGMIHFYTKITEDSSESSSQCAQYRFVELLLTWNSQYWQTRQSSLWDRSSESDKGWRPL